MANSRHLEILSRGVAAWNKWRLENPNVAPDLSNAKIDGKEIRGINFSEAILTGSTLAGSNLENARMLRANLSNAFLANARLNRADFTDANLSNASLRHAQLMSTCFAKANLSFADLRGAKLFNVVFDGADVTAVKLYRTGGFVDFSGASAKAPPMYFDAPKFAPTSYPDADEKPWVPAKNASFDYSHHGKSARSNRDEQPSPLTQDSVDPLTILVDPGSARPQEVGELLSEISVLYKMLGGSGVTFRVTDVRVPAVAMA